MSLMLVFVAACMFSPVRGETISTPLPLPEMQSTIIDDMTAFSQRSQDIGSLQVDSDTGTAAVLSARKRGKFEQRLSCMRPIETSKMDQKFDLDLKQVLATLRPGRSKAYIPEQLCGVYSVDEVVTTAEAEALIAHGRLVLDKQGPQDHSKKGNINRVEFTRSLIHGTHSGHLLFMRLLERVRRVIASRLGIPRKRLRPATQFISLFDSEYTDSHFHCDESSFANYHFSAVLYLNTAGKDFEGGSLAFKNTNSSTTLRLEPRRGRLAFFSSGWENPHIVEPVTSGKRWSVPIFLEFLPSATRTAADQYLANCAQPRSNTALERCSSEWPLYFDDDVVDEMLLAEAEARTEAGHKATLHDVVYGTVYIPHMGGDL